MSYVFPLFQSDLACKWQYYFDTASLMSLSSASKNTYNAYRHHFVKRVTDLFFLKYDPKADCHGMLAPLERIPKGETSRLITHLQKILDENMNLAQFYLFQTGVNSHEKFNLSMPKEIVPFRTREMLVNLCGKLWLKQAPKGDAITSIDYLMQQEEIGRFSLVVARKLLAEQTASSGSKALYSKSLFYTAISAVLATEQIQTSELLQQAWNVFKAEWNNLDLRGQSYALTRILGFMERTNFKLNIHKEDLSHTVALLRSFATDTDVVWTNPVLKEIYILIADAKSWHFHRMKSILVRLSCAHPTEELLKATYRGIASIFNANEAHELDENMLAADEMMSRVELNGETVSKESIGDMLQSPDAGDCVKAVAHLKKIWNGLSASEQVFMAFFMPKSKAEQFMVDKNLVWADSSIQKLWQFLLIRREDRSIGYPGDIEYMTEMLQMMDDPEYSEDRPLISHLLSSFIDPQRIHGAMGEWSAFKKRIAQKTAHELSLLTGLEKV